MDSDDEAEAMLQTVKILRRLQHDHKSCFPFLGDLETAHILFNEGREQNHGLSIWADAMGYHGSGGYWVLEAQPRQWLLRKPTKKKTEAAREELKAEILAAEMGHLVARQYRKHRKDTVGFQATNILQY